MKWASWLNLNFEWSRLQPTDRERFARVLAVSFRVMVVVFLAYILAGMASAGLMMLFIDAAMQGTSGGARQTGELENISRSINYRDLQKAIKDRNIFNSEGVFPDEPDPTDPAALNASVFDENAPCAKCTLNVELLGTIYLGDSGVSIATLQEKGYQQADVYKAGDVIIGSDNAKVHKIEQKKVIINNNGKKECLELDTDKALLAGGGSSPVSDVPAEGNEFGETSEGGGGGCTSAVLEEKYVSEQMGTGFDKILSKGRLVPHNKDTMMVGFKLIGMDPNSLFGKVCLKNGDVITQVNETSLQQPDQGFAFYQAFQDEQNIRISLLRNGTNPMTINVQIK